MKVYLLCYKTALIRLSRLLLMAALTISTLSGCTSADNGEPKMDEPISEEEANSNENDPITTTSIEDVNASTSSLLVESYTRYLEAKEKALELFSEHLAETQAMYMMSVLSITMVDVMVLGVSVCGIPKADAVTALQLLGLNSKAYDYQDNHCSITYLDEENGEMTIHTSYDPNSDSMQFKVTNDGQEVLVYEYAKMKNGYASQYLSQEDDAKDIGIMYFSDEEIRMAIYSDGPFTSIYQKSNLSLDDVLQVGLYMTYADEKVTIIEHE